MAPGGRPAAAPVIEGVDGGCSDHDTAALPATASWRFAGALGIAFLTVVALALGRHEIWLDELQAWVLARDSASVAELLYNMRYEGHPAAWHLMLFGLSRLTRDPAAMQLLHLVLATGVVVLIGRYAPFSRPLKVLIAFGYFFAFEYAVLSRGYALGALALFACCTLFPLRRRSYLPLALALGMLANTSVYGLMLSLAFGAALLLDWLTDAALRRSLRRRWAGTIAAVALYGVAAALSVVQIPPPPDATFSGRPVDRTVDAPLDRWALASTASLVWNAYVPVPRLEGANVWETNVLPRTGETSWHMVSLALSLGLVTIAVLLVIRKPTALSLYLIGTGGLLLFAYTMHFGRLRHHGHLFLLLLAAVWLARGDTRAWRLPAPLEALAGWTPRAAPLLLAVLLSLQVVATARIYVADWHHPFAVTGEIARLVDDGDAPALIATQPIWVATALAGHLDRPVYALSARRYRTFALWGTAPLRVSTDSVVHAVQQLLTVPGDVAFVITDAPLPAPTAGRSRATLRVDSIAHFPPSMSHWSTELFVYRLSRP